MKYAIVGSRKFLDFSLFEEKLNSLQVNLLATLIISGGCAGTDKLAEQYAKKYNIPFKEFKADWAKYKKAAGPIRNNLIANECEKIIAFVFEESKGTNDVLRKVKDKEKIIFNI